MPKTFGRLCHYLLVALLALQSVIVNADGIDFKIGDCSRGDHYGPLATVALLQKKPALSDADFSGYWRDVHGLLAARIPGFWRYSQYHLAPPIAALSTGSDDHPTDELQGIAEVSYCSESDIAVLANSPVAAQIMQDEKNVFAGSYLYAVSDGDAGSLIEPLVALPTVNKPPGSLLLLVAKVDGEQRSAFKEAILTEGQRLLTSCPGVETLRFNFFQPYQADAWPAPGVNHILTQKYNALVALQLPSRKAAIGCLQSGRFFTTAGSTAKPRKRVVYPVAQGFTMVADGKPTQLGLRGLPAYQLIEKLHADNQQQAIVLDMLYGK